MDNLITIADIKQYKDIGSKNGKTDTDKIVPIIIMAQSVDLQDFLGTNFYNTCGINNTAGERRRFSVIK